MGMSVKQVVEQTLIQKVVPLASIGKLEAAKNTISALYDGGSKIFELTLRDNDVVAISQNIVSHCRQNYKDLAIGYGSVSDVELAEKAIKTRPDFIVSPGYSDDIRLLCADAEVLYVPGFQTATEFTTLLKYHTPIAKLFPGGTLGIKNTQAVLAPFARYRHFTSVMVTGGVTIDQAGSSIPEWLKVVDAVGLGQIIGTLADEGKFQEIEKNMAAALKATNAG